MCQVDQLEDWVAQGIGNLRMGWGTEDWSGRWIRNCFMGIAVDERL